MIGMLKGAWAKRSPRQRALLAGAGVLALAVLASLAYVSDSDARLLRSDPSLLPANAGLMRFGDVRGGMVFRAHCASCHGTDAKGDPRLGAPNLTDQEWLYGAGQVGDIERTVDYGIRSHNPKGWNLADMPGFGRAKPYSRYVLPPLTPQEISDTVEFLQYLGGKPADQAAVVRGSALFQKKGDCADCHTPDAKGDAAIGAPDLTDNVWLYGDGSRKSVYASVAEGHAGVCPAWITKLSPAQIRAASVYVYSLSHGPSGAAAKAR